MAINQINICLVLISNLFSINRVPRCLLCKDCITQWRKMRLRHHLLGQVLDIGIDVARVSSSDLCTMLLYGKPNGSTFVNRIILEATISLMKS